MIKDFQCWRKQIVNATLDQYVIQVKNSHMDDFVKYTVTVMGADSEAPLAFIHAEDTTLGGSKLEGNVKRADMHKALAFLYCCDDEAFSAYIGDMLDANELLCVMAHVK